MPDKHYIRPYIDGEYYRFQVERSVPAEGFELFKIIGRNKIIILRTNRMLLQAKGLKHRKGDWMIVEGDSKNPSAVQRFIDAVILEIEKLGF